MFFPKAKEKKTALMLDCANDGEASPASSSRNADEKTLKGGRFGGQKNYFKRVGKKIPFIQIEWIDY